MYIEGRENETFHQLANSISALCPSIVVPRSGGAIEEKVRVKLKNGDSLIGISYKGDVEGWRARFVGYCEASKRKYGLVKQGRLFLSNGFSSSIEELEITFEQ